MKFVGWLVYWLLGIGLLYVICGITQDFDRIYKWPTLITAIYIIAIIGWGGFLAWWVNQDE